MHRARRRRGRRRLSGRAGRVRLAKWQGQQALMGAGANGLKTCYQVQASEANGFRRGFLLQGPKSVVENTVDHADRVPRMSKVIADGVRSGRWHGRSEHRTGDYLLSLQVTFLIGLTGEYSVG
jgi:hypothetical protein